MTRIDAHGTLQCRRSTVEIAGTALVFRLFEQRGSRITNWFGGTRRGSGRIGDLLPGHRFRTCRHGGRNLGLWRASRGLRNSRIDGIRIVGNSLAGSEHGLLDTGDLYTGRGC